MSLIGVYGVPDAAQVIYFGLHALQHRGQEGAGIAVFDSEGKCFHHRGLGLAGEVLKHAELEKEGRDQGHRQHQICKCLPKRS